MDLHLASDRFAINEGAVHLWNIGASGLPHLTTLIDARIHDDLIIGVAIQRPGDVALTFQDCVVRSRSTQVSYRIRAMSHMAHLTREDLIAGRAEIDLGPLTRVRLTIAGENGSGSRSGTIGIALLHTTLEAHTGPGGYVECLLPPGEHQVYTLEENPIRYHLKIAGNVEDAGTITLRRNPQN